MLLLQFVQGSYNEHKKITINNNSYKDLYNQSHTKIGYNKHYKDMDKHNNKDHDQQSSIVSAIATSPARRRGESSNSIEGPTRREREAL